MKKMMRVHYPTGRIVRELEMKFERALKADDYHMARHYDTEIDRIYRKHGIAE